MDGSWIGVLKQCVWLLKQHTEGIEYKVYEKGYGLEKHSDNDEEIDSTRSKINCHGDVAENLEYCHSDANGLSPSKSKLYDSILRQYFQLDVSLVNLYQHWSEKDPNFKAKSLHFMGVRQLRIDPVENLFSFICSSNNNIARISGMVESMCQHFGEKIAVVDGVTYYAFPTIQALAGPKVEEKLRELKFGYRAKYISQAAKYLCNKDSDWLYSLRNVPYSVARDELLKISGIGPKVADCICLMSLDKTESIPVDTHVFQLALRDYRKYTQIAQHSNAKTVTAKVYKDIGDFFRELWGSYAGWAQSVLFSAELSQFKHELQAEKGPNQQPVKRKTPCSNRKRKIEKKSIDLKKKKK